MHIKDRLISILKDLRLSTIYKFFHQEAERARQESLSYEEYLLGLVEHEWETRRQNRITRQLRASRLPLEKSMDNFDKSRMP